MREWIEPDEPEYCEIHDCPLRWDGTCPECLAEHDDEMDVDRWKGELD